VSSLGTHTLRVHAKGAVQLERREDGLGRILRGEALNRELLGGWVLGLVEAAETVAVAF